MSVQANDIWRTIGYLEEDTRGLLAKLGDLRRMLATVDLPKEPPAFVCQEPSCGVARPTQSLLDEHLENVHGILVSIARPPIVDEYAPAVIEEVA